MKYIRSIFVALAMLVGLSTVAHAGGYDNNNVASTVAANYSKLSDSDKQKLLAELSKTDNSTVQSVADGVKNVTPEDVEKWSNAGKSVGVAIGAMVKELGVGLAGSITSFTDTTVGKVAVGALLFKLFHNEAEHYLMCGVILFVFLPIWFFSYRRNCLGFVYEEDTIFGVQTKRKRWQNIGTDEQNGWHFGTIVVMFAAFVWIFLSA